jgi:hypothetical protein
MSHPDTKARRVEIGRTKARRRAAGRDIPERCVYTLRDTGRPCSCWICKRPRYVRQDQTHFA